MKKESVLSVLIDESGDFGKLDSKILSHEIVYVVIEESILFL